MIATAPRQSDRLESLPLVAHAESIAELVKTEAGQWIEELRPILTARAILTCRPELGRF